jgi:hypothetical protein
MPAIRRTVSLSPQQAAWVDSHDISLSKLVHKAIELRIAAESETVRLARAHAR